ncbi:neprosin family prolyl endopeptidase [Rhodanobacter sp. Col0626]|uniref:neprosin family prolyl endopeptidase n=1 Tax=Rhodanobacter sp. Col0626 TaxID=3415679 RepID=UPI003CF615BC
MRRYLDNAYDGLSVLKTVRVDGQVFDCIPTSEQPALRGKATMALPPAHAPLGTSGHRPVVNDHVACGTGTVPFARMDLRQLARFPSLQAFLQKNKQSLPQQQTASTQPLSGDGVQTPGGAHHYAVIISNAGASGGANADLNIWNPSAGATSADYGMSLSQIWVSGKSTTGATQTLEVGWQVQPNAWHTTNATPFVYSTQDGYSKTGCYNLECGQFVQTSNSVVFGSSLASNQFSVPGGVQPVLGVQWYWEASSSNWWLAIDGDWVGYYPASIYNGGDLAFGNRALTFEAGGEIASPDGSPSLAMGSGQFASTAYRQAAFITNMFYIDSKMKAYYSDLSRGQYLVADPGCYTLSLAGINPGGLPNGVSTTSKNPQMSGASFYMGGPGCH